MKATAIILIDKEHSLQLMRGERVTIHVPENMKQMTIQLTTGSGYDRNYLAECMDTFFNGRKAR